MHQNFCVGFLFSSDLHFISLIEKLKPDWMRGKLNGIGGTIEEGELPSIAMSREFKEETSVEIPEHRWEKYATVYDKVNHVTLHFFKCIDHDNEYCKHVKTVEKEYVQMYNTNDILTHWNTIEIMPNLRYLIPMATSRQLLFGEINSVLGRC